MMTITCRQAIFFGIIMLLSMTCVKASETKSFSTALVPITALKVNDPVLSRKVYKPGTSPQTRGVKPISVVFKTSSGGRIFYEIEASNLRLPVRLFRACTYSSQFGFICCIHCTKPWNAARSNLFLFSNLLLGLINR